MGNDVLQRQHGRRQIVKATLRTGLGGLAAVAIAKFGSVRI
jgi:hypothetical protein